MISLAVWCTKRFGIFQRQQTAFALRARAILLSFKTLNCIPNHVITYTKPILSEET